MEIHYWLPWLSKVPQAEAALRLLKAKEEPALARGLNGRFRMFRAPGPPAEQQLFGRKTR